MDKEITFDKLPEAVTYLTEQVSTIKKRVSALRPPIPKEKSLIGIDEAYEVIQKGKPTMSILSSIGGLSLLTNKARNSIPIKKATAIDRKWT